MAVGVAADQARDLLAWQTGRVVLGDAKTFDDLSGVAGADPALAERSSEAMNLHAFRLMKRAMQKRFGRKAT